MHKHAIRILPFALATLGTLGCPSSVETTPRVAVNLEPDASSEDETGDDERAAPPVRAPGSGQPDETNGECRLYAPELPEPKCCTGEYGFDAQSVQKLCGHPLYLGESAHFSCGYWFHTDRNIPVPFRVTLVNETTAEEAVKPHLLNLGKAGGPKPTIEPVPGVPDALWVHHNDHHWAFIPGWSRVRQLAWRDASCSSEAMPKVIEGLRAAKEPPKDAPRLGLVPKAR